MTLSELKREFIITVIYIAVLLGLQLFPYSLVAVLWNSKGVDAAVGAYQAMVQSQALKLLISTTLLVLLLRVGMWFEHKAKEPRYSDREDGYKAGGRD